jgi:hypothetical protein
MKPEPLNHKSHQEAYRDKMRLLLSSSTPVSFQKAISTGGGFGRPGSVVRVGFHRQDLDPSQKQERLILFRDASCSETPFVQRCLLFRDAFCSKMSFVQRCVFFRDAFSSAGFFTF